MAATIETQRILQANDFGCIIFLQSIGQLFLSRIEISDVRLVMLFVMKLKLDGSMSLWMLFQFH